MTTFRDILTKIYEKLCTLQPRNRQNGEEMGKASFHGEKAGKSVVCLSANLQTGNQTIIPTDSKTVKYSTEPQIFNTYG